MNDPRRIFRYFYLKFLRLKGDPAFLARGTAIGVFIGITPTIPLHTILAISLAYILRSSKVAALMASIVVSNPFTFFLQYYFSWRIGAYLTQSELSWDHVRLLLDNVESHPGLKETMSVVASLGWDTIMTLILGGCIIAAPLALFSYFLSFRFYSMVKVRRDRKRKTTNHAC